MQRHPKPDMERYAGALDRRAEAVFIDGLLVVLSVGLLGYLAGLLLVGGTLGGMGGALFGVQFVSPFVFVAYYVLFEGYYGQTPGKRARGIVVARSDGSPITWGGAVIRNLLRIVDSLPAFYLVGIVVSSLQSDNQRLGDVVGDTVVVHTEG